jgi:Na+/alanine symporter
MEAITEFVGTVNGIVWGIPMLILILGAGLFLANRGKGGHCAAFACLLLLDGK